MIIPMLQVKRESARLAAMKVPGGKPESYSSMSLVEFQRAFPDERACYEFLFRQFWPKGFSCPGCRGTQAWFLPSRTVFECGGCGRQISLTAGSLFHKSKVPLHLWFWMIFLLATDKKGCAALQAQRLLGLGSYKTAWFMAHKIRHAMLQRDRAYTLSGTIEVDESYYGGKRRGGKRGRGTTKRPVLIACENRNGKPGFARMTVLASVGEESVGQALAAGVRSGSRVRSDGLPSYSTVQARGFEHDRQVIGRDPQRNAKVLPWVHVLASNSKRFLLSTHHGIAPKYLARYLGEFMYRYNRRQWQDQLFERLLFACLAAEPTPEPRLTSEPLSEPATSG